MAIIPVVLERAGGSLAVHRSRRGRSASRSRCICQVCAPDPGPLPKGLLLPSRWHSVLESQRTTASLRSEPQIGASPRRFRPGRLLADSS